MADNENLGAPQSRNEALLQNILGGGYDLGEPQSRNEVLLMKIAGEDVDVNFEPQSRIEALLMEIIDQGGGGSTELTDFIEGNLTTFSDSSITKVRQHCFRGYTSLTSVNMSAVTTIEMAGFYDCTNLDNATFANLTKVAGMSFRGCGKLTALNAPLLTNLSYGTTTSETFANCYMLTSEGISSFMHNINQYAQSCFSSCRALTYYCNGTKTSAMPNNAFISCTNLNTVDIKESSVSSQAFKDTALSLLILRHTDSVAPLANVNAFANTPFASGGTGGTLYVPQALISSYQSATNWSTILGYANNQILPIEGSIYETKYADGTPIS